MTPQRRPGRYSSNTTSKKKPLPKSHVAETRTSGKQRILLSMFLVPLLTLTACSDAEITSVTTQDEAVEIVTVLYDNGIDSYTQEAGEEGSRRWKVIAEGKLLEGGLTAQALRVLRDNGLPRPNDEGREGAAREEGLLKSVSAEKAKRLKEMEIEIERQLRLLPGVVRVKTNVAPADEDALALSPPPATAAVVVVCKDKEPGFTEQHVRELVAGGVPKLKPDNVRVAMTYEPPRPLLPRAVDKSRRNRLIVGGLLFSLLSLALVGAVAEMRRRRNSPMKSSRDEGDQGSSDPTTGAAIA